MKFGPLPLDQAEGHILGHNIAGPDGRRLLRKGRALTAADVDALRALGRPSVYVAVLEPDDVGEDQAARRVAGAVRGPGLRLPGAASGRANLLAEFPGLLRVEPDRLARINAREGLTLATLPTHSPVRARQIVATVKIIPYSLPEADVRTAEAIARDGGPLLRVEALPSQPVGLILSGASAIHARLLRDFAPLRERVEALGSQVSWTDYVSLEEEGGEAALAEALARQRAAGARLILLAGETAIMDRHDMTPRAVVRVGGVIESVGAPVDPGNLLMLAYLGDVPVIGAPGCARSRKVNIVDWVLPRLLAGDRLTRPDIAAMGHGGLLEDAPERPMPRGEAA